MTCSQWRALVTLEVLNVTIVFPLYTSQAFQTLCISDSDCSVCLTFCISDKKDSK